MAQLRRVDPVAACAVKTRRAAHAGRNPQEEQMERRLLLSTVAVALALGTVAASAQTRRPSDQDRNAPQSTQAQPPQGQVRGTPQAQGQQQPNAQNPAAQAPSATTGQAAPQPQQPNAPAANNQRQQPAAGQAQTQPQQQGGGQQGQAQTQPQGAQQGQAQPGMTQQPGNTAGTANNAGAGGNTNAAGNADGNANTNGNANAPQNATADQHGVITLNEQQNTRVATAIRQANVKPLTNVNFSIAVGTTIPADVQVHPLPPALVEIVPQYGNFNFVVVEQEALIIDPNSRAIVAVVPLEARQTTGANTAPPPAQAAPPPAQAAAPPPRREHKNLTRDQRESPRRQVERHRKTEKDRHVTIEERRTTSGVGPREPRVRDREPDTEVIEQRRPVEVYRDRPPVRDDGPHPLRDLPLIGPLFGPPDHD
jgi:Protein of unknown function (DUF1236)